MDHIINNLWLGGQQDADDLVHSNPEEITAILNVRGPDAYQPPGQDESAKHPGKAYKWIPAPDTGLITPDHVREALAWLQEQTDKRERILVHCKYGISRSPGFLAAFLVKSGISSNLEDAKATISSIAACSRLCRLRNLSGASSWSQLLLDYQTVRRLMMEQRASL